MLLVKLVEQIKAMGLPNATSQSALEHWHEHSDDFPFLLSVRHNNVPLHVSCNSLIAHSTIIPSARLAERDYVSELLGWNFPPSGGYTFGYSLDQGNRTYYLSDPMEDCEVGILEGSIPVFFPRFFAGYRNNPSYVEINQRVSHVLDLHWVREQNSWCEWNELGEIIPVAQYYKDEEIVCCTLDRKKLDAYLFLANSVLVQVFEFSRYVVADAPGNAREKTTISDEANEIYGVRSIYGTDSNCISFMRGFQIIRPSISEKQLALIMDGIEQPEYSSFIILDWKNKRTVDWSCDPTQLGNYFEPSDLPFETSPAFFKPEVLSQYRQDPTRYRIGDREVECYYAWSLPYDINDAGQVFVYICDLNTVPHQVQLHWKAYNEPPQAGISERAFKTDFEGDFDVSFDPLSSLKQLLTEFPSQDSEGRLCPVWRLPHLSETRNIETVNYVITTSQKEWEDQIMTLTQILVEGLNTKYINQLAEFLDCRDTQLGSIKQLARILEVRAIPETQRASVIAPLLELQHLRSSAIAHVGNVQLEQDMRVHFRTIIDRCEHGMRQLAAIVTSGALTL